jgi:hypothetical protein
LATGTPRPRTVISLTPETAKAVYGNRSDVVILTYHKEDSSLLIPPKHLPEDAKFSLSEFTFPETKPPYSAVLLDIKNPNFTFQRNHLLDDENRVIYEPKVKFDELPIKYQFLGNCKKLNGTIAYLSNTLFCHYGHWVQTQMPLLLSYWETFGKENIDYYYIGDGVTKDFVEDSLVCMGVPKDRIINFPCRGDRSLISIKYRDLEHGFKMDPFSHTFLQKSLFKPGPFSTDGSTPKRLFVMRGNVKVRKELNLPAIKEALSPFGFTFLSMDGKSMQDEATLFGNADIIIAVHGSALHNVLFSRPETKVVEIFPHEYFEASNFYISNYGRCDYYYLIGEKTTELPEDVAIHVRNDVDVLVNTKKLLALCEMALGNK